MEEIKQLQNDIEVYDMGIDDAVKEIKKQLKKIEDLQQWKKEARESINSLDK